MTASRLDTLATQLGSHRALSLLPGDTFAAVAVHADDVVAVGLEDSVVVLPDLDVDGGYQLWDRDMNLLYEVNADPESTASVLADQAWGTVAEDVAWVMASTFGEYAHLVYATTGDEGPRHLLLVRA